MGLLLLLTAFGYKDPLTPQTNPLHEQGKYPFPKEIYPPVELTIDITIPGGIIRNMDTTKNPGLRPCNCHPNGKGVALLDFDNSDLYAARDENAPLVFRGTEHTFPRQVIASEISRRFLNRFRVA